MLLFASIGSEADFVILSFVRSNPAFRVGFLKDIQRLNVALTRAKLWLFGVGSVSVLEGTTTDSSVSSDDLSTGRHSQHLRDLVRELRHRNCIFSAKELEQSFQSLDAHSRTVMKYF